MRQLIINKIFPSSIATLYKSIQRVIDIYDNIQEDIILQEYLDCDKDFITNLKGVIEFFDTHLFIDVCNDIHSATTFNKIIIKPNIYKSYDDMINKNKKNEDMFKAIYNYFNILMPDCIKIHETDKYGLSLQITKKRATILKSKLNNNIIISSDITIQAKDIKFISVSGTTEEIEFPLLKNICKELSQAKELINNETCILYNDILKKLEVEWFDTFEIIVKYVGSLDVVLTKAYISEKYNYCCPELCDNTSSFVEAYDIRHCLIEHIQQDELYVCNDIFIGGKHCNGMLIYGTNAVGKTSLIRSLGICVILAQSGMFVPCSRFLYKPYTAIYSRILGNDNIFKGLSTFAVEMSELRVILRLSDSNSLILGDELCSGTETESALSIFVAGLDKLHTLGSSFVFATHFHEIVDYEEIKNMDRLCLKHMSVIYDRERDCLIYDRKLKDGSGDKVYGLEVCKSLHMPEDFLEMAYTLRNKYFPDTKGELSHKTSSYNKTKVVGNCEICNENIGEEVHHLLPQKLANEKGFIGAIHKNHKANLVSICQKCHKNIHKKTKEIVKKKTTKGYKLVFVEN
jgi:DNA mismatch repair protein MutS